MQIETIKEIFSECFDNRHTFEQHILALVPHGVLGYHVDLKRKIALYQKKQGQIQTWMLPQSLQFEFGTLWDVDGLRHAIQQVQGEEVTYTEFLHRIAKAGVIAYAVDIFGGKATYLGSGGNTHVEPFSAHFMLEIQSAN